MPKRKPRSEQYINDDGILLNKSAAGPPSAKKQKTVANGSEAAPHGGGETDKDGGVFWELSNKRRVQVSTFQGKQMVGIREYYEKDGEMLPGKKGISLTTEQFDTIVTLLPSIEAVLKQRGHVMKRPEYTESAAAHADGSGEGGDKDEEEDDEGKEEELERKKKNFEDTSEDE